jgi:cell division protein FtsX
MSTLATDLRLSGGIDVRTAATAAVIEEARRRQRRRRRLGALAVAASVIIVGAAWLGLTQLGKPNHNASPTTGHSSPAGAPAITLYLKQDATRAAVRNLIATVSRERDIARVTFLSKTAALTIMRRRYPTLVGNLVVNPLTDSINVRLSRAGNTSNVVARLTAQRLPEVERIRVRPANK